jgi:hypothetical protein
METVVGIFQSRREAEEARLKLHLLGVDNDKIATLSPGITNRQVQSEIRTSDTEAPGIGAALGGTVGGAVGAASGASLAAAATSLFVPGVGPIVVAGVLGATLFGASGAFAGVVVGSAVEHSLGDGLPHDDLYLYEDALRKGHNVLVVGAMEADLADQVRGTLTEAGAESVDAAREDWWLGLQDAQRETYEGDFDHDGAHYRRGFETALHPKQRGRSLEGSAGTGADNGQSEAESRPRRAFRSGYENGQAHQRSLEEKYKG